MRDYPQAIAETNRVEPAPRRVRGVLAGEVVFDSSRALYVWESEKYPQYYIPVADVNAELLVDEDHPERLSRGTALRHGLRVGAVTRPGVARLYSDDSLEGLAGTMRFDWDALDAWFEEDEEVFVHPRNPYARVDALRSARPVRIELDGAVLAASDSPVMLFETGTSHALLLQPHARGLRAPRGHGHRQLMSLQGTDERLLVGAGRRGPARGSRLVLFLSDARGLAHRGPRRVLQREGRRRSGRSAARSADHALREVRIRWAAERV